MFTDKQKALDFAYIQGNGGYKDWPDYISTINKKMKKRQRVSLISIIDDANIFLHLPFVSRLIAFLPVISILSLFRAYPRLRRHFNGYNIAMDRYVSYLYSLRYTGKVIDNMLAPSNPEDFAFTGSSLLKVLLGADWDANDVDVVSYNTTRHKHGDYPNVSHRLFQQELLKPVPCFPNSTIPYSLMGFNWPDGEPRHETSDGYPGFDQIIAQVLNYRVYDSEHSLQVIQLQCGVERYVKSFDLDICANYMSTRRLVIKNPLGLLKQTMTYMPWAGTSAEREQKTRERIEKYRKRGFKL